MLKCPEIKWPAIFLLALSPLILWHPWAAVSGILLVLFLSWAFLRPVQPVHFWIFLLAIFYFFPYSSINPAVRSGGNYFTLFRKFGGLFSVWDFLLFAGLLHVIFLKLKQERLTVRGFDFPEMRAFSIFGVWAFVWGWLHIFGNLLGYGPTDLLRPFVVFQVFFYFLTVYLLTLNWLERREDWEVAVRWLKRLTWLLALYGMVRFAGILSGKIETMWPFGLPVVLYDQMTMLYLPVFTWVASLVLGKAGWRGLGGLALFSTFFILISARRFNYFLLVAGTLVTLLLAGFLAEEFGKKIAKIFLKLAGVFVLSLFILGIFFPSGLKHVGVAFQSINIYKKDVAAVTGSDIRRQELKNLVLNLNERPYGYFVGLGWGTKWKAIAYQPLDSFSYTEKYLQKSLGWFPQFHLPYVGLLYRYGVLGLVFFWGILGLLFYRIFKRIRRFGVQEHRPLFIGMLAFLLLFLPTFGDSANPTFMILAGFYLGLLEFRLTEGETQRER